MPRPIDLTKLTSEQLKNLLTNCTRHGQADMAVTVVREMTHRGIATAAEFRTLAWNQDRVREILLPFKKGGVGSAWQSADIVHRGRRP
jgi:pentatricopeptide repeat protein